MAIAGGSYLTTQSPPIAVSTFAIGFLIDGDHLFDYAVYCFQKRRRPNFREFFNSSCSPPPSRIYILLHSYELLLLIWLMAISFSAFPWAVWLSLSFGAHLLMDYLAYRPHPLCYFLTFRIIRGFSYETVCQNNQKTSERVRGLIMVARERSSYDQSYSLRPFELRVPGDALKDKIIYNVIQKADYKGKRLLDVGCGMGHTASLLSNLVDVVGIDFSKEAIRIACQKSKGAFIRGGAHMLPFPDDSYDYVVAKDILEHVPDDEQVLDEILRVCRGGAMLLMYLPCKLDGFNFSTESIVEELTGYTLDPEVGHLRRYTPKQAQEMLQSRGFKNIKVWYFVHFSLGVASLLSVKGYRLLSRGKKQEGKIISGIPLLFLKLIFKIFEVLGHMESAILKSLPGAGFFIVGEVEGELRAEIYRTG